MIGKTISHYKIIEKLGEGGMGVVYKAQDTTLDRFVAIKFLPSHLSKDEEATKRFIHEAKAASALDHANIGTIYDVEKTSDGQTFIVMAHYEGETLRQRIDRGAVTVKEAIHITSQIAVGLAKAHEKGIVHRDIKPSNIIVTSDGEAKIIDFGLAKLADKTRLTKEGITVGTIAYMSPEQAKGEEVDHRSDIFSLGAVLYELLTGEPPFKGEHEAAVLYEIVHENPETLSTHLSDLPDEIQQVIDKALAKSTDERYQSAREIMDELEELREYSSTRAGSPRRYRREDTNKRKMYVIGIAAVVIIVAAVAVFLYYRYRAPIPVKETLLAVVDFSNLADSEDHTLSVGISGLIHTGLVESSPCRVVSPTYLQDIRRRLFGVTRGPIEENQALEVAREAGAAMLLTGQIMPGANAYVAWDLMDIQSGKSLAARRLEGGELITLADQIIEDVLPLIAEQCGVETSTSPRSASEMTTVSPEAYQHYMAGVLASEEGRGQEAIREITRAVSIDSTFALAYFELSFLYTRESGLARVYAEKAWELRERLGIKDRMRLEAWMNWVDYRTKDALVTHREILTRWPDDRDNLLDLTSKLFSNYYHKEALQVAEQGLKLYPDDFINWYSLTLASAGRLEEALGVIKIQIQLHPRNPNWWAELGLRYLWLGLPDSAVAAYNQALEIEPHHIWAEWGLGASAYFRGDVPRAIELTEQFLERSDMTLRRRLLSRTRLVNISPGLSLLNAEGGRFKESLKVIEESKQYASDPESELQHVRSSRNKILLRMGQADEVLDWARDAKHADLRVTRLQAVSYQAQALVVLDSLEAARSALAELRETEQYYGGYTQFMVLKISADIALAEGNAEGALNFLHEMQEQLIPWGGLYDIEIRENLARAHWMADRPVESVRVHQEILRVYGGHALSHYELGKLYEEMNRPKDAKQEYEKFLEMWSGADEGLPQVEDTKRRLAALEKQNNI